MRDGVASVAYLRGWYDVINKKVYGGKLPVAEIVIGEPSRLKFNPARTRLLLKPGRECLANVERVRIVIQREGMTRALQLLIHEMVHVRYPQWEHGYRFDREIMRVRRIAVTHDKCVF